MIKIPVSMDKSIYVRVPFFKKEWAGISIISKSKDDDFLDIRLVNNPINTSNDIFSIDVIVHSKSGCRRKVGNIIQQHICNENFDICEASAFFISNDSVSVQNTYYRTFQPDRDSGKYGFLLSDDFGNIFINSKVNPHYIYNHHSSAIPQARYRYCNGDMTMIYEEGIKNGDQETPMYQYTYDENGMLIRVNCVEEQREYDITYFIRG